MIRCLPAEWAPQDALLLTWPHGRGDWGDGLAAVERSFIRLAAETALRQDVIIGCYDADHRTHVETTLREAEVPSERVRLHVVPSNDVWARDHGPITVLRDGAPVLLDFRFNGWGRKFPFELDDAITRQLHAQGAFGPTTLESVGMVLEGGSIESDGEGTLLTTISCQLSPQRNPDYDCIGLEARFGDLLGTERTLWLEHGRLAGDDTDGHIDTLARFCDPHTIAHVTCDDPDDEHFAPLQAMADQLAGFRDRDGAPYRLVPLPLPAPSYDPEGRRLPATYANFIVINGAVLVPTYHDAMDGVACERLAEAFPGREVVAIDARPLITQNGSLHCAAMQLPAGVLRGLRTED